MSVVQTGTPVERAEEIVLDWPLLTMQEERGCTYCLVGRKGAEVHLLIWRRDALGVTD